MRDGLFEFNKCYISNLYYGKKFSASLCRISTLLKLRLTLHELNAMDRRVIAVLAAWWHIDSRLRHTRSGVSDSPGCDL